MAQGRSGLRRLTLELTGPERLGSLARPAQDKPEALAGPSWLAVEGPVERRVRHRRAVVGRKRRASQGEPGALKRRAEVGEGKEDFGTCGRWPAQGRAGASWCGENSSGARKYPWRGYSPRRGHLAEP
jgi:hypothetical protein